MSLSFSKQILWLLREPDGDVRHAEYLLQRIWHLQALDVSNLKTTTGLKIAVLAPGTWNHNGGPDFRNAIVRIGQRVVTGSVEIHFDAADWVNHGHHTDPAYEDVVLHVVVRESPVLKAKGIRLSTLVISPDVAQLERMRRATEREGVLFCYPRNQRVSFEIRRRAVLEAAEARIQRHMIVLEERFREHGCVDQLFFESVCDALGFAKNRAPFLELARRVPLKLIRGVIENCHPSTGLMRLQALLFGSAGLLPSQQPASSKAGAFSGSSVPFIGRLEQLWADMKLKGMDSRKWQFFRLRPANFPTVRLAGLCRLLMRFTPDGFEFSLRKSVGTASGIARPARLLARPFVVETYGYWSRHHLFGDESAGAPRSLIGLQRAHLIVVNAVLPVFRFLALRARDTDLLSTVEAIVDRYPAIERNAKKRMMVRQLFSAEADRKNINTGVRSDRGLLELNRKCEALGCRKCPVFAKMCASETQSS